jgi:hypothetical protein
MAQARVGEGHVERYYQHIGFVSLRGGGGLEPGRFEFRDHTRRTEQKEPFGLGMVRTDVVDGGQCGGVHPFTGHPDAHPFQFVQVVVDVFRRVVRQERVTDSQRVEFGEEGFGPREKCRAHVDRAVHVECDVPDRSEPGHQFFVCQRRIAVCEGVFIHGLVALS